MGYYPVPACSGSPSAGCHRHQPAYQYEVEPALWIPEQAYGAAIIARTAKNVIELALDLPMLFILLPIALTAYQRVFRLQKKAAAA